MKRLRKTSNTAIHRRRAERAFGSGELSIQIWCENYNFACFATLLRRTGKIAWSLINRYDDSLFGIVLRHETIDESNSGEGKDDAVKERVEGGRSELSRSACDACLVNGKVMRVSLFPLLLRLCTADETRKQESRGRPDWIQMNFRSSSHTRSIDFNLYIALVGVVSVFLYK